MLKSSSIKWNFFFQIITVTFSFVNGILFVPLYVSILPPSYYGAWLASGNILNWITIIDPGISTILQQNISVAYGEKNVESISRIVSVGLLLTLVVCFLILAVGSVFSIYIPEMIQFYNENNLIVEVFVASVIGTSLTIFSYSLFQINLGMLNSVGSGIVNVLSIVVGIAATVLSLYSGLGLWSFAIAIIIRGSLAILGHWLIMINLFRKNNINVKFGVNGIKDMASTMSMTFVSRMGGVVAGNVDAFLIARLMSTASVPIYELTRKLPETSRILIDRPSTAILPALSYAVGERNVIAAKEITIRAFYFLLWALIPLPVILFCFTSSFVSLWVGAEFFSDSPTLAGICITVALTSTTSFMGNLLFAIGEIKFNIQISLIQAVLSIVLSIFGAYHFGFLGLAFSGGVAAAITGLWLYPVKIIQKLSMQTQDILPICFEICKAGSLSITLMFLFMSEYQTWLHLVVAVLSYLLLYFVLSYTISSQFRSEINKMLRRFI